MNDKPKVPAISRRGMLSVLAAAAYTTSQSKSARGAPQHGEAPNTHKWMLVGSQTAFLSHLPMFEMLNPGKTEYMTPHRYQVILQASFNSGGKDVTPQYFADRQSHPAVKMYTVSPTATFVLPRVAAS